MFNVSKLGKMKYLIKYPDFFDEFDRFPAILFLHGAGTRGEDPTALQKHSFFQLTAAHENFPFVVVMPQCSENTWFDHWEDLKRLVQEIAVTPFVDPERIYLMGASMGGYATWQLAMSMPEYFAAIVPICGGGMYWNAGRLVNVPVWAFHGALDRTVLPEESKKMVDRVNSLGGNARLTLYPENKHDAWRDTFSNPEVFSWLLSHKKMEPHHLEDQYKNSDIYG